VPRYSVQLYLLVPSRLCIRTESSYLKVVTPNPTVLKSPLIFGDLLFDIFMRISVSDPKFRQKKVNKKIVLKIVPKKNRYLSNIKFSNKIDQHDQITKSELLNLVVTSSTKFSTAVPSK